MPEVHLISKKIHLIRGHKVMLDSDLATLYGVSTKSLNLAVKRNLERFPKDFRCQLTDKEYESILRFQIETSKWAEETQQHDGRRYLPYALTSNGIAMLSSVLRSPKAIKVNIEIMRTFTRLQEVLFHHQELKEKLENLEKKYDGQFQVIFDAIKRLMEPPRIKKSQIGFHSK